MSDLISREEALNLIDTAFESGAFDGRYAYENLIDAVQNLIHPLETDLISRQAVIQIIENKLNPCTDMFKCLEMSEIKEDVEHLSPVEPERKSGKWIPCTKSGMPLTELGRREGGKWYGYKCSECNHIYKGNALTESLFCQKCGADMREVDG